MSPERREAYKLLRWYSPGPAERARLKKVLGWRRTHEETLALVSELLELGMVKSAITTQLGITDRHLRRVLAELGNQQVGQGKNGARNRSSHPAQTDISRETDTEHRPSPPIQGFASCEDLDRWLEEHHR
jgi:hypothetical protein